MSKLWLHLICSNNFQEIDRMTGFPCESQTKEPVFKLIDGIVATVHIAEDYKEAKTFSLLDERMGDGKIFRMDFLKDFSFSRNLCLRQGIIKEGDWVIILDAAEYINPDFIIGLKNEIIPQCEKQGIGAIYQLSKCVIFKYWRDVTYHCSVHTGMRGLRGSIVDLQQHPEFSDRKTWIWSERDNELSWVRGSKYFFFPDSNHTDLVYEASRFPNYPKANELQKDHRQARLAFFDYCREELGFEVNEKTFTKYLKNLVDEKLWPIELVEWMEYEKILKTFFRYYVLQEDYRQIFDTENDWSIKKYLNIPISLKINDIEFLYISAEYNKTYENERFIELSLAKWFIEKFKGDVTEVGCVSPYYYDTNHLVIDLYDAHPKATNLDAMDNTWMLKYKNVLSISTFEHIKKQPNAPIGEYDDPFAACELLDYIIQNSKNWLISTPIGDNRVFEKHLVEKGYSYIILRRKNKANEWEIEQNKLNFDYVPYRNYQSAEAILVITNLQELL